MKPDAQYVATLRGQFERGQSTLASLTVAAITLSMKAVATRDNAIIDRSLAVASLVRELAGNEGRR